MDLDARRVRLEADLEEEALRLGLRRDLERDFLGLVLERLLLGGITYLSLYLVRD